MEYKRNVVWTTTKLNNKEIRIFSPRYLSLKQALTNIELVRDTNTGSIPIILLRSCY